MKHHLLLLFIFLSYQSYSQQVIWSSEMNVASSLEGNLHPRVVVDASGDPLIVWGNGSSNDCKFSKWNGTMFSSPVTIQPSSIQVFTTSWAGPDIASKGDTIYIVIKETPEDVNQIYIVSSFDGGQTFSAPAQVDFVAPDMSRFPTVTITDDGNPVVAFMKFDSNFSNARWVVTRSSDYGLTFSSDEVVSGWSGGVVCDCCPATIIGNQNTIAVLYRDNSSNIRDSWATVSTDNGMNFTYGWNVDLNNWMIMACPSTGPDGCIIDETLYSVFMNGANGSPKVYFSESSLNNFQTVSVTSLSGINNQNYPRISNSNSALGIIWKETVSGENKALFKFTPDIALGISTTFDTIADDGVANADIAIYDGKVYVVWQDDISGTVKFRSGSYIPVTTNISKNKTGEILLYPNPVSSDEIQIHLKSITDGIYEFKIENLSGQSMMNSNARIINGKANIKQFLKKGMYVLKVKIGDVELVRKFIRE